MNAITKQEASALPALSMDQSELMTVLQSSLYPGAQEDSIRLVLGYCKASGLDPMQKPVHIVPMWDRNAKAMRDVIMPGIGLYRTQAARSGALAGISEPEFGPDVQSSFGDQQFVHPDWCRVTVTRRMDDGKLATFTAREYWLENYATASKDSSVPNAMWKKRPRGQLAKCAQAQALRMAFPEMTGSQPTAEELEGKTHFDDASTIEGEVRTVDPSKRPDEKPAGPPAYSQEQFDKNLAEWVKTIQSGRVTVDRLVTMVQARAKANLTEEQRAKLTAEAAKPVPTAEATKVTYAQVAEKLHAAKDQQALDDAASLINAVPDEQQQTELTQIYEARWAELKE